MKKRNRITMIAWALLLCMIISCFAGCKKDGGETKTPAETLAPTEATAAPVSALPTSDGDWQTEETGSLKAWKLTPVVWSSSNGATVTVSAIPREYDSTMGASFVVRLNGGEIENRSCDWNGSSFEASVDLPSEDGYEFEFVLFPPHKEGEPIVPGEHVTLTDAYMNLANLKSTLEPACTLLVDDYRSDAERFDILACFATVRLPQLSVDGKAISLESARMILMLNGTEVESKDMDLKPDSENVGSYTASGTTISFRMPEMKDDYYLDLSMSVKLSNGEELTAQGGTWYYNNGALSTMNAG